MTAEPPERLGPDWRSPLPPGFRWPDGVRAACFTFDVDAESPILFELPESTDWLDSQRIASRARVLTSSWASVFGTSQRRMDARVSDDKPGRRHLCSPV